MVAFPSPNDPSVPLTGASDAARPSAPRELHSHELLCGQHEVIIRHGTEAYRLSLTRNGKLILRK
jgi:hemin uptake protein HemP